MSTPEAEWYESSTGYIGYYSIVYPGLICRVYEAVLSVDDGLMNRKDGWQYTMVDEEELDHTSILACESQLLEEAVKVTNKRRAMVLVQFAANTKEGIEAMNAQTQRIRLWRSFGMTERTFRRKTKAKQ